MEIELKHYDYDEKEYVLDGTVNSFLLAENLTTKTFATVLEHFLNVGGKGLPHGKKVGQELRKAHRTVQRLVVRFILGILVGISEQDYTDPRNGDAIKVAKKIAQMVEDGELDVGPMR